MKPVLSIFALLFSSAIAFGYAEEPLDIYFNELTSRITKANALNPGSVVLDTPTSALDPMTMRQKSDLLFGIKKNVQDREYHFKGSTAERIIFVLTNGDFCSSTAMGTPEQPELSLLCLNSDGQVTRKESASF